jgi:Histidine kinase-, DNA gyrase B-, and HSP90-like ATPase
MKNAEAVPCTVLGDEARLHQIPGNLLGNSLKFTPGGGSVTVQLRKTRTNAIIVVRYTGQGISPDFLPHIFKRFSQDEAGSRENGGMGLGLAICKYLVELHGGSINAESAGRGRGATIKVKLRIIESKSDLDAERPAKRALKKEQWTPDTRLKDIKVVAVDDNADARELLKVILERNGAETAWLVQGKKRLQPSEIFILMFSFAI